MSLCNCNCRCSCTVAALVVSAIIGVIGAFLQITGVITLAPVFLWVAFGIAVGLLGLLVLSVHCRAEGCTCSALDTLLAAALATVLLAAILLAVGITATSIVSAIFAGLLLLFFTLTLTGTACFIRSIIGCDE